MRVPRVIRDYPSPVGACLLIAAIIAVLRADGCSWPPTLILAALAAVEGGIVHRLTVSRWRVLDAPYSRVRVNDKDDAATFENTPPVDQISLQRVYRRQEPRR